MSEAMNPTPDEIVAAVDEVVDAIDVDRLDELATGLWPDLLPNKAQDKLIDNIVTEIRARLTGFPG